MMPAPSTPYNIRATLRPVVPVIIRALTVPKNHFHPIIEAATLSNPSRQNIIPIIHPPKFKISG